MGDHTTSNQKRPIDDVGCETDNICKKKPCIGIEQKTDSIINTECLIDSQCKTSFSSGSKLLEKQTHLNTREVDCGIKEYISNLSGFFAVMKERYSDFLVNEIDLQGNLVTLTNMDKPEEPINNSNLADFLGDDVIKQIQDLVDKKGDNAVIIEVTDKEKHLRKGIHEAIRKHFHGLDSSTEDIDDKKVIIIKKQGKQTKGRRFRPVSQGNYIQFVLYKENRDTMDAINTISSFLRISSKSFSYAGTKDKRGKTSQLVSVYKLAAEKLLGINKKFNMIKVGNIEYRTDEMRLGDLSGNKFAIILRQLKGSPDLIEEAIKSLASRGFINYYGMQRFGTTCVATHSIGRYLLLGDWKNAINLILKPRGEGEDANLAHSRKIWMETGDAKKAFQNLKYKSGIEAKLLKGLSSHNENDFVNALNSIPRNTRLMYIHSYQSYIWNQVLSRRIKKYGLNVLIGDLISDLQNELQDANEISESIEHKKKKTLSNSIKQVSEKDISKYSIQDVLLPLPGHSVTYPNNETKEWYEEFLKEDGMDLSNFESRVRTYSLSGTYRKIVVIPSDVKWEIIPYDDVSLPLALSDLDILQGVSLTDPPHNGSFQALKLELKLPSSSYATMAVREILKCDTCYSSLKLSNNVSPEN